jgi:hypothetical protein
MPQFGHAIVVYIEADTYEASLKIAEDIAEGLCIDGEECEVPHYEHDNENQRMVYLHDYNPLPLLEDEDACDCPPTGFCDRCGTAEDFKLHESDRG